MEATFSSGRILFVDLGAAFGGAEIYLENLLRQLPQEFTCHVLCANPELQKRLAALKVRQFALPCATGAMKVLQLIAAAGCTSLFADPSSNSNCSNQRLCGNHFNPIEPPSGKKGSGHQAFELRNRK